MSTSRWGSICIWSNTDQSFCRVDGDGEEERLERTRVIGADETNGSWRSSKSLCAWDSDIYVLFPIATIHVLCLSS